MQPEVELAMRAPMWVACRAAGLTYVPRGAGGGYKTHCPFEDLYHPDGGDDPAMRVYDHHAFCFACWKWWSPVSICAAIWEVSTELAAARLLDAAGLRPPSWQERYEKAAEPEAPDTAVLAEALRVFCSGEAGPRWEDLRMDPTVGQYLSSCLGYLPQIRSDEQAREWMELSEQVMRSVLTAESRRRPHAAG